MKYKFLAYLLVFLVLAATISLIYYQQITGSLPNSYINPYHQQKKFETYKDPEGQFEITYPVEYSAATVPGAIVEISPPSNVFPKTNYSESMIFISKVEGVSNAANCKKYSNGASQIKLMNKKETVNGTVFDTAEITGAAAGNLFETRIYRVFRGATCYSIDLTLHTTNIGNYPEGEVTEVDKNEAWKKLNNVLQTFRFSN